jgi:hypothetical protein
MPSPEVVPKDTLRTSIAARLGTICSFPALPPGKRRKEASVIADYFRQQARTCLQWARDCFDLQTAARLRLMAEEFSAKAAQIEADARYEMDLEQPSNPRRSAPFEIGRNAS